MRRGLSCHLKCILGLFVAFASSGARAEFIDFQNSDFLRRLKGTGGLYGGQVPMPYVQAGMTVIGEVKPRDTRLGGAYYFHVHLAWEDVELQARAIQSYSRSGGTDPDFAFTAGRRVKPHAPDGVIQLTYDPDGDGRLDRFDVISLDVIEGPLNVGVRFADGSIGVYNNLTSGFRWFLIDANGLTRMTLEGTTTNYTVDNIEFRPASRSAGRTAAATTQRSGRNMRSEPIAFQSDPLLHDAVDAFFEREVAIDVVPANCQNRLPPPHRHLRLPVVVLGNPMLSVGEIDRRSVRLNGVSPDSSAIRPVAVAAGPLPGGGCGIPTADRFPDLYLVFDPAQVREALGADARGRLRPVELTAVLRDGSAIRGRDTLFVVDR